MHAANFYYSCVNKKEETVNVYFNFFSKFTRAEDMIDNSKPKINAHKNPSMWMPDTNLSASKIINTFITRRKIPRVRTVIGSVSMINIGFTIAFKIASTKAKINAVTNELMRTCGVKIMERP